MPHWPKLLTCGFVVLVAACSTPEPAPYLDLVESFPIAAFLPAASRDGVIPNRPAMDLGAGHLFLPAGSQVTYSFFAESRSSLAVERLAIRGKGAAVAVEIDTDAAAPRSMALSPRSKTVKLGLPQGEAVQLTVRVTGGDAALGDGALLTRPVVRGVIQEAVAETLAPPSTAPRPNVIIYLVDTLRRDRLGVYGYDRPTSPAVDAFASQATLFANSHAQSTWTKPTVASIFTGVWPPSHSTTGWRHRLPEEFETLAERLQTAGYKTAQFVTNVNASATFGAAQGFDTVWYQLRAPASTVNEEVFTWLDKLAGEPSEANAGADPFFLYVHTMEPHARYAPKEPFLSQFAPTAGEMPSWTPRWRWPVENLPFFNDLYDGEVAQSDDAFGKFLDRLRQLGLYEDALVIFMSDHGEEFQEHGGWRHNRVLHAETLDVPIIVKFPGQQEGKRSEIHAAHVDVLPTVLDVAGLPAATDTEGQSLARPEPRPIFSHLRLSKAPLQYSVIRNGWKLIRIHREEIKLQLFDISTDPGEKLDLATDLPVLAAALSALLDRQLAASRETDSVEQELLSDTRKKLRALGYLQ